MKIKKLKLFFLPTVLILLLIIAFFVYRSQPLPDDFSQGIFVINVPKSEYLIGESALFPIASFDLSGHVLCNSQFQLEVIPPHGLFAQKASVKVTPVVTNTCSYPTTSEPDYIARFTPQKLGVHQLVLTNLHTKAKIYSSFRVVGQSSPLVIERWAPTRLQSNNRYPMQIKVTTHKDYSDTITESLPEHFSLSWYGNAHVTKNTLSWDVKLIAGQTLILPYEFTFSGPHQLIKLSSWKFVYAP